VSCAHSRIGHKVENGRCTACGVAVVTSGTEFDWAATRRAAELIIKQCDDAAYVPPELATGHQRLASRVCAQIDVIAAALKLVRGDS